MFCYGAPQDSVAPFIFLQTYIKKVRNKRFYVRLPKNNTPFQGTFSRHGKSQASLALLIWLNENVPFHGTFSRHGITRASSVLLIWLNEKVLFHSTFSRHGKAQASLALLIWLNENVLKRIANMWLAVVTY